MEMKERAEAPPEMIPIHYKHILFPCDKSYP